MARMPHSEKIRKESYQVVLATDAGKLVMDDLVIFAQQCTDPVRALGRSDVVLRFLRERTRSGEAPPEESEQVE